MTTTKVKNAHMLMIDLEVRGDGLWIAFADGIEGVFPLKEIRSHRLEQLDLSDVTLPDPYTIEVKVKRQREPLELPWDFVRRYVDPTWERQERQHEQAYRRRLGTAVRTLRDERGWTRESLAERAGVGVATLERIENGREHSSTMDTIRKIAKALGADWLDLLEAADKQSA